MPPGPPGVSREAKLSTEFKFGGGQEKRQKMMVLWHFLEVSWFWTQFQQTKLPCSNSVDDFASLDTPGGPGGIKVVVLFVFENYFSCFLDATWRQNCFLQIEAWYQRYTYRVLQTIQMKLILLCVWAEWAVLGSAKTASKFKYVIEIG